MAGPDIGFHAVKGFHQFLAHNDHFRTDQIDAVLQYAPLLGGVEHGTGHAHLGGTGDHGEQLRAVFQEYGDGIAPDKALCLQETGNAVGPTVEFPPGNAAVFEQDGRAVSVFFGVAVHQGAKGQVLVLVFDRVVVIALGNGGKSPEYARQAASNVTWGYVVLGHRVIRQGQCETLLFVLPPDNEWLRG